MASIGCMCTHHASSAKSESRMASAVISIRPHLTLSYQLLRDPLTSFSASLITDPTSFPRRVPAGSSSIESSFFCFCDILVPCLFTQPSSAYPFGYYKHVFVEHTVSI